MNPKVIKGWDNRISTSKRLNQYAYLLEVVKAINLESIVD